MLATDLGCKIVHVPGNLLVGDASIDLGGLDYFGSQTEDTRTAGSNVCGR